MAPLQQSAVITQKNQLNPHVFQFTFQTQHPVLFTPGQYATVIIDAKTRRQYSFCSPANNSTSFDIVVDVSPMGPGSKFFMEKKVGDRVEILAPLGNFIYTESSRKKIFIATGTGIAPFRSMIITAPSESIVLYWGLRHEEDVYWQQEFEEFSNTHPNVQFILTLSQPSDNWVGKKGHVQDHLFSQLNLRNADYYICGNKDMVSDVREKLLAAQVPTTQVKSELFY